MRDFDSWLATFKPSIADYTCYANLQEAVTNVEKIKIPLCILNALIGSENIEEDFEYIITQYPETLKCIPILIGKREMDILVMDDERGLLDLCFCQANQDIEAYITFMEKIGLFDMLKNKRILNLVDYVTGVETGLDSNARKNRGEHLMEDLVERYLRKAGLIKDKNYFKEMHIHEIEEMWHINLSSLSNNRESEKSFDFVVKGKDTIYGIKANFYTREDTKLNEIARSYTAFALEAKNIPFFKFIWITDGHGWNKARNKLKETYDVLEDLYNIHNLENNILPKVLV